MDRPIPASSPAPGPGLPGGLVAVLVAIWVALVITALVSASGILSALCAALLLTLVLARHLWARRARAWAIWLVCMAAIGALTVSGHGRTLLDGMPVAINLGLAVLFGHTLFGDRVPLIARVIVAMEGRERLQLPGVAGYARGLTAAWAGLFLLQALLMLALILRGLGNAQAPAPGYLHLGGYFVPALFMVAEYAFRRWYLRHLPHDSPQRFLRRLVQNWPRLLHDLANPVAR